MNSQTFVETIEQSFENIRNEDASTLAQAVSNELMRTMPRLSPELFERTRTANITLSDEQKEKIDETYLAIRDEEEWNKDFIEDPTRICSADIPIFAYARVPEQTEVIHKDAGIITYTETMEFDTEEAGFSAHYFNSNTSYGWESTEEGLGRSIIELKAVWTAPFTLDVCVKVPEVPDSVAELTDEALFNYYRIAAELEAESKNKSSRRSSLAKPRLGILWAPTDEVSYCIGDIATPAELDYALILEIPDEDKSYRHVIAMQDIKEERPFRNWLKTGIVEKIKELHKFDSTSVHIIKYRGKDDIEYQILYENESLCKYVIRSIKAAGMKLYEILTGSYESPEDIPVVSRVTDRSGTKLNNPTPEFNYPRKNPEKNAK